MMVTCKPASAESDGLGLFCLSSSLNSTQTPQQTPAPKKNPNPTQKTNNKKTYPPPKKKKNNRNVVSFLFLKGNRRTHVPNHI